MRHSLSQLLAASPGPGEPAAAFSLPGQGSAASRGVEAEAGGDEAELLFPGLELDEWLEAEAGWARDALPSPPPPLPLPPPPPPGPGRSSRLRAAEAARLNRQRKKQYVQGLESRLQGLAAENRQLRDRNRGLCRRLRSLEREAGYLRAVLANQSALGRLLSRLAGRGAGLRLSSSLWKEGEQEQADDDDAIACRGSSSSSTTSNSSSSSMDHDYALPVPREDGEEEDAPRLNGATHPGLTPTPAAAGLCLHVDRDQVSVEFCALCSRRAAAGAAPAPPAHSAPSSFAAKIFFFRCLPCQAPLCRG
ncbi:CREB/ATF bZIP transcription factor [Paroedura picta]|uniref:CREB/ATF bZIP transcription factor n=1 Tax=Paroedura picta TaxID=143630 RepID=UPI0040573FEE